MSSFFHYFHSDAHLLLLSLPFSFMRGGNRTTKQHSVRSYFLPRADIDAIKVTEERKKRERESSSSVRVYSMSQTNFRRGHWTLQIRRSEFQSDWRRLLKNQTPAFRAENPFNWYVAVHTVANRPPSITHHSLLHEKNQLSDSSCTHTVHFTFRPRDIIRLLLSDFGGNL